MSEIVDKDALRRHVERCVGDLPAMSEVVARVIELTDSPTSSEVELEAVVSTDQALTAKVLRVVNSAFYGIRDDISSIRHAVRILGMRQLRNLTLSIAAMSMVKAQAPHMLEHRKQFWRHSFGVAVASGEVAKRTLCGRDIVNDVFTGGLLHDIGRLFLLGYFFELYDQTRRYSQEHNATVREAEQALLGIEHGEIGMMMSRFWDFPEPLVQMVRWHHGPVPEGEFFDYVACVHLGNFIVDSADSATEEEVSVPDPNCVQWAKLTPEVQTEILAETEDMVRQAEDLIRLSSAA